MKTVNIQFAKAHLSQLVDEVAAGHDVVIVKAGKPVARLVVVTPAPQQRELGALAGRVKESRDAWGNDADTVASFY